MGGGQFEHIIDLVKQTLVKVVGKLTLNLFWENFITPCSVILCVWPIIFRKCHPFQSIRPPPLQLGRGEYLKALRERHNLKHQNKQMKLKEDDVVTIRTEHTGE